MTDKKEPLSGVLNLRIDDTLSAEIDRIARLRDESSSEVARRLLSYGAEVERRLQAQRLMQNYDRELTDDVAGRVVISAEFVPYTWREAAEIQDELAGGSEYPARHPRWEDVTP